MLQNLSKDDREKKIVSIKGDIGELNRAIEREEIRTITDLESYMVVKERLVEAEDYIKKAEEDINSTDVNDIVYAAERANSAYLWYALFDHSGKQFNFNEEILKSSCQNKLSEAEERYQYLNSFVSEIRSIKKELDLAYKDFNSQNYALCLFKASQTKSEADFLTIPSCMRL